MGSDNRMTVSPEIAEMIIEDKKRKRMINQILVLVIGVIMTVVGIYVIGQQVVALGDSIQGMYVVSYVWHPLQLECGIFVTLVGTILMTVSINSLIAGWIR